MQIKNLSFGLLVVSGLFVTSSHADAVTPSLWDGLLTTHESALNTEIFTNDLNNDRRKGNPPKEAVEACEGKSEGDSCEFKGRNDKEVTGTCQKCNQDDDQLVCKPNRPNRKGGGKRKEQED